MAASVRLLLLGSLALVSGKPLYGPGDPLTVLDSGSLAAALTNSSAAWLLEFYSSWCGHCINYAPTWRQLAADVTDWEPVIRIGVIDCAEEKHFNLCKEYGVQYYPTFRFFKAFTTEFTQGQNYKSGGDHEVPTVRQMMIDFLQESASHTLDPIQPEVVTSLLSKKEPHYTAVVFESADSYIGREVMLDLIQYEGMTVRRVLNTDKAAVEKFGVVSVPSVYMIYPNGTHGLINNIKPLRSVFSAHLKSLAGVRKKLSSRSALPAGPRTNGEEEGTVSWKEFDKSKMYMADLESGLHYVLRVEMTTHPMLEGEELKTFKDLVAILFKLFPGRPHIMKLLETLQDWLVTMPLDKVPYNAILDLVNNKMQISGIYLTQRIQWVSCQGSEPGLRGYPCSLWKLFHTLTVQAAAQPDALVNTAFEGNSQAILQTMRRYIKHFFGCRECAQNFEAMASESIEEVKTPDEAVMWLWKKHNVVNNRLQGSPSEDVKSPKVQWPTPDLCPGCHGEEKGVHFWNEEEVQAFLKRHYGRREISVLYSDPITDRTETQEMDKKKSPPSIKPRGDMIEKKPDPQKGLVLKPALSDKIFQHQPDRSKDGDSIPNHQSSSHSLNFLGFSNIDMSLCVVLYITSMLFLMIMYFFFRVRSRRWKIRYNRPYV
ncbi:sulfhydryl oxidase 2 [Pelodytes ibericus]